MATRTTVTAVASAALLVLAGCGGGSGADDSQDGPAPRAISLPTGSTMGAVDLVVRDRDDVIGYYKGGLGLKVLDSDKDQTTLGHGTTELVRLIEDPRAPAKKPTDAGLYHVALLYEDNEALANTLVRLARQAPQTYQGASDHAVSLAFYFGDPAGNGIELYVDRPRDEWDWKDGEVTMGSAPLDINKFIQEHATSAQDNEADMGHLHLSVGDLDQAEDFYVDTIGFDVTSRSDGALFMAADGYHHHLAVNTWNSDGAAARPEGQQGLGRIRVEVPDQATQTAIAKRLTTAGHQAETADGVLVTADPWNNVVEIAIA